MNRSLGVVLVLIDTFSRVSDYTNNKRQSLHVFKIWIAIVISESNHEPKFLADDTRSDSCHPTQRVLMDTLASCCDVPMIMNSVAHCSN